MEYKVEILEISDYRWDDGRERFDELEKELNARGEQGWHIVGIHNGEIFLERQIEEDKGR